MAVKYSRASEAEKIANRVIGNVARTNRLITLYEQLRQLTSTPKGRSLSHFSDILRSAVVFSHATLEDGLRSLLRQYLPRTREVFDGIGLEGLNDHGRPEKFHLGELHRFAGQTVEQIWERSLLAHLQKQSFNDVPDICRAIGHIGLDPKLWAKNYPHLAALAKRRHHIVHNADKDEKKGIGHHFALSIKAKEVRRWNENVAELLLEICDALANSSNSTAKRIIKTLRGSTKKSVNDSKMPLPSS